jgi:hypothetical protein
VVSNKLSTSTRLSNLDIYTTYYPPADFPYRQIVLSPPGVLLEHNPGACSRYIPRLESCLPLPPWLCKISGFVIALGSTVSFLKKQL